jgi:hypothetical protein
MQNYPAGGPREPVYELMRSLGFSMSNWSDKFWNSADGIEVSIYGAGSMARLSLFGDLKGECELDNLGERVYAIRRHGRELAGHREAGAGFKATRPSGESDPAVTPDWAASAPPR